MLEGAFEPDKPVFLQLILGPAGKKCLKRKGEEVEEVQDAEDAEDAEEVEEVEEVQAEDIEEVEEGLQASVAPVSFEETRRLLFLAMRTDLNWDQVTDLYDVRRPHRLKRQLQKRLAHVKCLWVNDNQNRDHRYDPYLRELYEW